VAAVISMARVVADAYGTSVIKPLLRRMSPDLALFDR